MNTPLLNVIEIETNTPATASVIWLHGLGADGNDFAGIIPQLGLPANAAIRFIFPHAPIRPVTINGGMEMRAWYDIFGIGPEFQQDNIGVRDSQKQVIELIENEQQRGVDAENIVIAGFSQGGAIALTAGLQYDKKLAGVMALSTYLTLTGDFQNSHQKGSHDANQDTSIFMAHGESDPVVPFSYGEDSCRKLQHMKYAVLWKQYPIQHSLCLEEIQDIREWLCSILGL